MSVRTELWLHRLMFLSALILFVGEVIDRDWLRSAAWGAFTIYFAWQSRPRTTPQT